MAISADKANVTIDFQWESEDNKIQLNVKYHVKDGVPTISIESEDGEEGWYNLPEVFFAEVTQFLDSQKKEPITSKKSEVIVPQRPEVVQKEATDQLENTRENTRVIPAAEPVVSGKLPIPIIQRKADANGVLEPLELSDMNPLESLGEVNITGNLVDNSKSKSIREKRREKAFAKQETFNRPVLHGDEATSKALRGEGNESKSIKQKHQT